jgi:hypothetical protein
VSAQPSFIMWGLLLCSSLRVVKPCRAAYFAGTARLPSDEPDADRKSPLPLSRFKGLVKEMRSTVRRKDDRHHVSIVRRVEVCGWVY